MALCIIFGGAGYIGTKAAKYFLSEKKFTHVHIADIKESSLKNLPGISASITDVRNPITLEFSEPVLWIFNFAAVHREPGHESQEYYETNIKGAENVCAYAVKKGCKNIFLTSSISVYGPTKGPTSEAKMTTPVTPYGISKLSAEYIHKLWRNAEQDARLIICRPGVIYGPGDPGNILRMIKAIKKGYFFLPASRKIHKSYGYIYGLLESIDFTMKRTDPLITYNYVETPTETLGGMIDLIKITFHYKAPVISLPLGILLPAANLLLKIKKDKTPIHPQRVKKAATSTHIIPQFLIDTGFVFNYDFETSLKHWKVNNPQDF